MSNQEMIIKHVPFKKYPYEAWLGGTLIETFVYESTANEMLKLNEMTHDLYIKNEYEKSLVK